MSTLHDILVALSPPSQLATWIQGAGGFLFVAAVGWLVRLYVPGDGGGDR